MPTDEQNLPPVPTVYSNNIRLALSFTDIKVFFAEFVPIAPPSPGLTPGELAPGLAQTVDRVCITLPPEIVPALVDGLAKAVESYQAQFGPLRKVPQVMLQPAAVGQPPKPETAKS